MSASPARQRYRIVVDADACVPAALRERLRIAVTPEEPELLLERVPIPRLALERGPFDAAAVAQACAAVAEPGEAVVYVRTGDAHGSPPEAGEAARAAVEARGATFHLVDTGAALMGAGWAAVVAAEASGGGASPEAAVAAARSAAARGRVIAMLEHPEVVGVVAPSLYVTPNRMITLLEGAEVTALGGMPKREDALAAFRDQAAERLRAAGPSRIAVHHAAAGAAAEAMARWCERNLEVVEVVVAPVTRHQAARLAPGFIAIAWLPAA